QGDPAGDVAQAGDEGDQQKQDGGQAGEVDGDHVDVGGGGEAGHVVPQRVQPEPGLAGVAARLVHDPPLVAGQVHGRGPVLEVGAVAHEQQRFGVVGAVEGPVRQQVGVDRTAASHG